MAGGTYKLSAYIKTRGFKSRNAGLIIHNAGWISDTGFKNLPADSDWTFREKTFTLFPSRDKEYGVALFAMFRNVAGSVGIELASDAKRLGQDLVSDLVDDALREADRRSALS